MFVGPDRLTEAGDPFNMVETMRTALTKTLFTYSWIFSVFSFMQPGSPVRSSAGRYKSSCI